MYKIIFTCIERTRANNTHVTREVKAYLAIHDCDKLMSASSIESKAFFKKPQNSEL